MLRLLPRRPRGVVAVALAILGCVGCEQAPPPLVTKPAGAPPRTRITDVSIVDGRSPDLIPHRDVILTDGRITAIGDPGVQPATGELVIDGAGRVLMPGLIDVHGHTGSNSAPSWSNAPRFPDPERNLQSYLYAGVTTVLDPADLAPDVFERRAAVAAGDLLGPTIFAAGPIFTTPGGHPVAAMHAIVPWWIRWYVQGRMTREVATAAEARAAVAKLAADKPDVIKVAVDAVPDGTPSLGGDVLRAIVDEARGRGIRTVAHIGSVADALAAADAGAAAWMHGVYKERIPDDLIARFVQARIPMVATIVVFDDYADIYERKREPTALEREMVAADVLASFDAAPPGAQPETFTEYFKMLAATRDARCDNVRRLNAAGVPILAGADAQLGVFPGAALHRELANLARCGLSPFQAVYAATAGAARFVSGRDDPDFGTVKVGNRADLLLIGANPLVDVAAVDDIVAVIQAGRVLERHPIAGGT
jgi:imidazolonepropionase-like amidohydrolase